MYPSARSASHGCQHPRSAQQDQAMRTVALRECASMLSGASLRLCCSSTLEEENSSAQPAVAEACDLRRMQQHCARLAKVGLARPGIPAIWHNSEHTCSRQATHRSYHARVFAGHLHGLARARSKSYRGALELAARSYVSTSGQGLSQASSLLIQQQQKP